MAIAASWVLNLRALRETGPLNLPPPRTPPVAFSMMIEVTGVTTTTTAGDQASEEVDPTADGDLRSFAVGVGIAKLRRRPPNNRQGAQ
jgi:hypothetical protein